MTDLLGLVQSTPINIQDSPITRLQRIEPGLSSVELSFKSPLGNFALFKLTGESPETPLTQAHSADGDVGILVYGYLYNEPFNQTNPAQAILNSFIAEGSTLWSRLNGNFLILLFKSSPARLTLISDRTASQPLFFHQNTDTLYFSTSLKQIKNLRGGKTDLNSEAIASFLSHGFILEGQTFFTDVEMLKPAQVLTWQNGQINSHTYWQFSFAPQRDIRPVPDLEKELFKLLMTAVERRTRDDSNFGIALSGGYDSRALVGCARRLYPERMIHTVTWGESDQNPHSDAGISRQIARVSRTQHRFYPLVASALPAHFRDYVFLSEGRTDGVGNYPESLRIFHQCNQDLGLSYLLRGDENFGGAAAVRTEAQGLHRLSIQPLAQLADGYPFIKKAWKQRLTDLNAAQYRRILEQCPEQDLHDRKDFYCFHHHLYSYLNPLSQLKERAIGIRNPHLDNDVLDFISRVPTGYRLNKLLFKSTIQHLLPEVSQVEFSKASNLVNWDRRLQTDANLQQFLRQTLLQQLDTFVDFLDPRLLAQYIEAACSLRAASQRLLKRRVYRIFIPSHFYLNPSIQLFRLMIMKIWVEEYCGGEFILGNP